MPTESTSIHVKLLRLNPWLVQIALLSPCLMAFILRDSNHRNLLPQWDEAFLLVAYLMLLQWLWSLYYSLEPRSPINFYTWYRALGWTLIASLLLGRNFGNWIPDLLLLVVNILSIPLLIFAIILPFYLMGKISQSPVQGSAIKGFISLLLWPVSAGLVHRKFQKAAQKHV